MATKVALDAPDLLQRLGRPGFPKGMKVLLVGGAEGERVEIAEQLSKLNYEVFSCENGSQARTELDSRGSACYDIILAEAALVAKDDKSGQLLLDAASDLPLVIISSPGTTTECVWRGIEVGAADVLEKPLSLLKLQNIWQHVVRKAMDQQQAQAARPQKVSCKGDEAVAVQIENSLSSRGTPSSSISAATLAPFPQEPPLADPEASFCDSQDGKETSMDMSISNTSPENSLTVDSSPGFSDAARAQADCRPRRAKRGREGTTSLARASSSKLPRAFSTGVCGSSSMLPSQSSPQGASPTVMGIVHPSWANSQAGNQAFRGSIPPGCVWGTPLHPPPGWQGMFPNGSGPLLGSAANQCSIARCHSAPVQKKAEVFSACLAGLDGLPDLDATLMDDFADELLLGDDFLDCGDSFLDGLGAAAAAPQLEKPPIGLRLKKSESLLNLINRHLAQCQAGHLPPATAA